MRMKEQEALVDVLGIDDTTVDTLNLAVRRNEMLNEIKNTGAVALATPEELRTLTSLYFKNRVRVGKTPTPAGMCSFIGLNHRSMINLLNSGTESGEVLSDALEVIHSVMQEKVMENEMSVALYKFMSKNYWGLVEEQKIQMNTLVVNPDIDEIDRKLRDISKLPEIIQ